ncbi:MAG TPA: PDZ domain-containing protein, partial [Armatimonadota bacterium]
AEKAGLKVGDIVVALDGTAIAASQPEDTDVLPSMIRQYKVDSTVELTIIRDKATLKIPVQLPKSPMLPREMPQYRDENYDFSVRDIAFLDRIHNDWHADQTGIIIMSVNEGGWAALGRVKTGDLLVAVNGAPVASVAQMAPIMAGIAKSRPEIIILQVKRDNVNLFLELQGSWQQGRH